MLKINYFFFCIKSLKSKIRMLNLREKILLLNFVLNFISFRDMPDDCLEVCFLQQLLTAWAASYSNGCGSFRIWKINNKPSNCFTFIGLKGFIKHLILSICCLHPHQIWKTRQLFALITVVPGKIIFPELSIWRHPKPIAETNPECLQR